MNITKEWLKTHDSCSDGMDWFVAQNETDGVKLAEKLMAEDRFGWANWLIVRIMTRPQYLSYAIFSAEQVIGIYEAQYPNDFQPRKAIEAARRVLDNDSAENRAAAWSAWSVARTAGFSAWATGFSARATARDAGDAMQRRIIDHGLMLIGRLET